MDQNINLNAAACIQKVSNFGSTTYTNICSGHSTVVPWGTVDWFGAIAAAAMAIVIAGLFIGLVVMLYRVATDSF